MSDHIADLRADASEPLAADDDPPSAGPPSAAVPSAAPLSRGVSVEGLITASLVVAATLFVGWNVQPDLWLQNTTPTGGDMGAHVWSPAYLRDVLLPDLRLTGWSPDWYAGFPAFTFYMIIPSLLIVILNVGVAGGPFVAAGVAGAIAAAAIWARSRLGATTSRVAIVYCVATLGVLLVLPISYGAAMKLVVVAGMVSLPLAGWALGRLGGLAFPGPALLAVATIPFLFDRSFNIYGGNLLSTMAGEFAYSLGLSLAVVCIGVVARGLETGDHRGWAAVLLALAGLTHLFAAFFALAAIGALLLVRPGVRTVVWVAVMGPIAALLSAFWVLPFFWNRSLLNDMGWGKERRYVAALWDRSGSFGDQAFLANDPPLQLLIGLAVIGAVVCGIRRVRLGMALTLVALFFAGLFLLLPEGRLWNVRLLPFYYLSINLMAGLAVAEIGRLLVVGANALSSRGQSPRSRPLLAAAPALAATAVVFVAFGLTLRSLPGGSIDEQGRYSWLGVFQTTERHLGPLWATHNFAGYEGTAEHPKPAYAEYSLMVATMDEVGREFGCGRSLWEYQSERLGSYGTPMAPMLLPHWTDGCIGSMEGLYFEASATTPYHFLLQSELSQSPSRAQRDLPYSPLDITDGVGHLQDLGVRYYMAFTDEAVSAAQTDSRLTELATAGPWVIFLVDESDLVVGLDHLPVVVDGVQGGGEDWLVPTVGWWEAAEYLPLIAASGPEGWPRTSIAEIEAASPELQAAIENGVDRPAEMRAMAAALPVALPSDPVEPVVVSDIETDESSISFTVDQIGQPVLVRTSYFPNWSVDGAEGPYRVAPNLMVVVPTDINVELQYGRSGVEVLSMLLTVLGVAALVAVRRSSIPDGEPLWDFGASALAHLPDRALVIDEVRTGRAKPASVAALVETTALRTRGAVVRLGVGLGLVAYTLVLHGIRQPTTEDIAESLGIWMPGIAGLVVVLFSALPDLVELVRYRLLVVEPARTFAATGFDPAPAPAGSGVSADGENVR
ncbi:MAG: hypothetical protein AAGC53_09570 [Actinomycetota bacterium]